ncbi:hypothetical protein Taro_022458 [Colocasia esculenta]|uniref:F-box domain-containing protein n=1 Tax=Colocasia esculenta TaxID=4460 RepID=A0A843V8E2_COLES|nr:hypothetical protein [Colocasia esculenta]
MEEEGSVLRGSPPSGAANVDEGRCGRMRGGERQMSGRDRSQMLDDGGNWGLKDERILALVCAALNWDPCVLSVAACVSRRLRAVAKRVLWRELCFSRAPRMVAALAGASGGGGASSRMAMNGGWHALAKIFFFCCGCAPSRHFRAGRPSPGHFVGASRFSKTSGRSFLARRCWGDLLYVSDPCEHPAGGSAAEGYEVGVYRGVFGGFMRSRTRACLIARQAELESRVRCPYCGARVWSMTAARLVPRSAARRLGSPHGGLERMGCPRALDSPASFLIIYYVFVPEFSCPVVLYHFLLPSSTARPGPLFFLPPSMACTVCFCDSRKTVLVPSSWRQGLGSTTMLATTGKIIYFPPRFGAQSTSHLARPLPNPPTMHSPGAPPTPQNCLDVLNSVYFYAGNLFWVASWHGSCFDMAFALPTRWEDLLLLGGGKLVVLVGNSRLDLLLSLSLQFERRRLCVLAELSQTRFHFFSQKGKYDGS